MRILPRHVEEMTDVVGEAMAGIATSDAPDHIKRMTFGRLGKLMSDVRAHNVPFASFHSRLENVWLRQESSDATGENDQNCRSIIGRCRSYLGLMIQFGPDYKDWMQQRPAIVAYINRKEVFFNWRDYRIRKQNYTREHVDERMTHQKFLDAVQLQKIWVLTPDELEEARVRYIEALINWERERHQQEIEKLTLLLNDPTAKW